MKKLILYTTIFFPFTLSAQPEVAKDYIPGLVSSDPSRLTVYNGGLYFFAGDEERGYELRKTDGQNFNTVKNIYPGATGAALPAPGRKNAVLNGVLYFPADDSTHGLELYSYDGTKTSLVSDIAAGLKTSWIDEVIAANGMLYFDADNGVNGKELWLYNPVAGAAEQLSYISTGAGSDPHWITEANGKIYFTANDPAKGRELFEYDPATSNVKLLEDIYPGSIGSEPSSLISVFGTLYFNAVSPDYGRELYKYDGSSVQRLTDLNPGTADGLAKHDGLFSTIGAAGNELFMAGNDGNTGMQLYKYDYVQGKTSHVSTINPSGAATPANFIYYANKIFFTANDGTHGRELWVLNNSGTASMVADINKDAVVLTEPSGLIEYKGSLYFSAYGDKGNELYRYTDPAAGIEALNSSIDIKVYPNPVAQTLFLGLDLRQDAKLDIQLADAVGKVVYKNTDNYMQGQRTIPINMAPLSEGLYFYWLTDDTGRVVASGRISKM